MALHRKYGQCAVADALDGAVKQRAVGDFHLGRQLRHLIRARREEFEAVRSAELAEVQRMEMEVKRRFAERQRRKEQEERRRRRRRRRRHRRQQCREYQLVAERAAQHIAPLELRRALVVGVRHACAGRVCRRDRE